MTRLLLRLAFWLVVGYVIVASAFALLPWWAASSAVVCGLFAAVWSIRSGRWDEPDADQGGYVFRPRKRDPASPD